MRLVLGDFKLLYVLACMLLGVIIISPTLALFVRLPGGERFSELWILGPGRMAEDYPFNMGTNETYKVFLGVGNHMLDLEYYVVYVKLRNQTEPLPDSQNRTPSSLTPVLEFRAFLSDSQTWEREVLFSFEGVSFEGNVSRVSTMEMNGYALSVNKTSVWDAENRGFYYQLFFELWRYNATASGFQFHNRFVGLWLNFTRPLVS